MSNTWMSAKPLPWILATAVALATGLILGYLFTAADGRGTNATTAATVLPEPRPLPDVHLISADGEAFGRRRLVGGWHLLFFGFTHCPDICPNTLGLLATVADDLAERGAPSPEVVFVSVDPRRDDPATLREYLAYFDPDFIGVTGSLAEIERLTQALYLSFGYTGDVEGGDYTVDHSGALILVDPRGRAVAYFSPPHDPDSLRADLRRLIRGR